MNTMYAVKVIFLALFLFAELVFAGAPCSELEVDASELEVGEFMEIPFGGEKVGIYRRSISEVKKLTSDPASGVDDKVPGWWPRNETPIATKEIATSLLRSENDNLFVFWLPSSVYGCYVIHAPKESSLGSFISRSLPSWSGGFFDPCYGVGYDYAGRSIVTGKNDAPKNLTELSLMIPPHQYIKAKESILLKCP